MVVLGERYEFIYNLRSETPIPTFFVVLGKVGFLNLQMATVAQLSHLPVDCS